MNWIDLICSILGLTCVILAGRNSKYNFWVGYAYSAALFVLFLQKNLYASLLLQPISLCINMMGHYRWTHPKKEETSSQDESSLKVSMLSWPQRAIALASVGMMASLWGFSISYLNIGDPVPFLDSCLTMLILVAQFLSAQKKWDCWIAWLLVNVTQVALHASVGHIFMTTVSCLYLVNGVLSLRNWMKLYRKNA